MEEIRKKQKLRIVLSNSEEINGFICDFLPDRVMVLIDNDSLENAKQLSELDEVEVFADTLFGVKKMNSCIINTLDKSNCLVIENTPTVLTVEKRQTVRITNSFDIEVRNDIKNSKCKALNISAGGLSFEDKNDLFNKSDKVTIILPKEIFSSEITLKSEILNKTNNICNAKYYDLSSFDESKIMNFIFTTISNDKR